MKLSADLDIFVTQDLSHALGQVSALQQPEFVKMIAIIEFEISPFWRDKQQKCFRLVLFSYIQGCGVGVARNQIFGCSRSRKLLEATGRS